MDIPIEPTPILPNDFKDSNSSPSPIPTAKKPSLPIILKLFGLMFLLIGGYFGYQNIPAVKVDNIVKECLKKGGGIGESYPPVCILPTPISNTQEVPTSTPFVTTNWKTYSNVQYGFSFMHPNFDDTCCMMSGALTNNPVHLITIADKLTTRMNTDKPFDGISVYAILNQANQSLNQFVELEKSALIKDFSVMSDSGTKQNGTAINSSIDGQPATTLINYSWDRTTRTYFKHPYKNVFIEITKGEESPNSFSAFDQILSTFKFLENKTPTPSPITYIKPPLLDTASWKAFTHKNIQFKAPQDALVSINDSEAVITEKGGYIPSATIQVGKYDGGSRRAWWINVMKATPSEVSTYMQFQDVMLGDVKALDVFADGGWWQGGYASPILIANGTTIVSIHGGRGLNPDTGVRNRYIFSDTVASSVKFIE